MVSESWSHGGLQNIGLSDKYMIPVLNTLIQFEKDIDQILMQLALVDICGNNNSIYKFDLIEGSI